MRIGIDARMMGPECGGIGRYIEQLVKKLLEIDKKNQYILFLRKQNFSIVNCQLSNVKCVLADIPWYSIAEQIKFKKIIKQQNVDLMHFPHWNVPIFYNDPFVVTVHDLIMWHYPRAEASTLGPVAYWFKDRVSRLVVKHVVKAAKHIITTSEFTKNDIHQALGVPREKMTVTYQAPFERQNLESRIWNLESFPKNSKFQIPNSKFQKKPYVLYVGSAYPHKNLERLLEAWKIIEEKYADSYQLVLVGKESFFYSQLQATSYKLQAITFAGFVPDDELEALYKNATLYIEPSLYEGFGLPPLEAMAHGIPVVSSNRSCLPEVLGEAALYFDPENVEQMAETILRGLEDEDLRFELIQKGREEIKRYSWAKLAEETREIYKKSLPL
ncbi:MAG: glycosyltransferase family 1 protein [Patescibacteria group bacterium]